MTLIAFSLVSLLLNMIVSHVKMPARRVGKVVHPVEVSKDLSITRPLQQLLASPIGGRLNTLDLLCMSRDVLPHSNTL
jgi:hypothetical protein